MQRSFPVLVLFFVTFLSCLSVRAESFDLETFSQIPVMHDGRIKPMQSFARINLKKLSGRDKNAMPWLVETLLNPAQAENIPVLKISNPDVINLLEIERRNGKLYSYKEIISSLGKKQDILVPILQTPEASWTQAQHDFVLLQQNTVFLGNLLNSLSLFLPVSVQVPENGPAALKPYADQPLTYLDILKFNAVLQQEVQATIRDKGENLDTYTEPEQATAYLFFAFTNLQNAGRRSIDFKIVPKQGSNPWLSPWQTILSGAGGPETTALFHYWKSLARAYHEGNKDNWSANVQKIHEETYSLAGPAIRKTALEIEMFYNQVRPFIISAWLYGLALLVLGFSALAKKETVEKLASFPLGAGFIFHFAAIAARVCILERPPVSTLYESIIFVGLIAVLYALVSYARNRESFWLFLGAGTGLLLHILGFSHNQGGDNFLMLTAVLNTNFWLATHVICITMGYAFCLITSLLAHYALVKNAMDNPSGPLFRHMHQVALLALLFSAVGTVLGGIWADQSWGRFWGWDPKENGALLIVLWLIWILHGRISSQMNDIFVTAGLAYLSVIVALSWFGVNLLSVGLHAYGFTNSAGWTLGTFIGAETILTTGLLWLIHTKRHAHAI